VSAQIQVKNFPADQDSLLIEMADLLVKGIIEPIHPITSFPSAAVEAAFVDLQRNDLIGKVVLNFPETPHFPVASVAPSLHLRSDVSYLLVGGLGEVGKSISTWMVECGARHLIYLSRSAGTSESDQQFAIELGCQGCEVQFIASSVVSLEEVQAAIKVTSKPIAGVIRWLPLSSSLTPYFTILYE
jgi:hypothetical protein